MITLASLDTFTRAYIDCALWSSTDESTPSGGYPLDKNYGPEDLDQSALESIVADCLAFQAEHFDSIVDDLSQAGHDFWLTRNGHGAGFWDGDWDDGDDDSLATRLTEASHAFGECDLYVGDDGKLYL